MDPPFTDDEKRFLLAEAIKTTKIPVERLLALINEFGVQPAWPQMPLPFGRNMNSCISAYNLLQSSLAGSQQLHQSAATSNKRKSPDAGGPAAKRRQSGGDTISHGRSIQPKPDLSGRSTSVGFLTSGHPKKRGRPSKADLEARNAEAIARGEILPPTMLAPTRKDDKDDNTPTAGHSVQTVGQTSPRLIAPNLQGRDESMFAKIAGRGASSNPIMVEERPYEQILGVGEKMKTEGPTSKSPKELNTDEGSFQTVKPQPTQHQISASSIHQSPGPQVRDSLIAIQPKAELIATQSTNTGQAVAQNALAEADKTRTSDI